MCQRLDVGTEMLVSLGFKVVSLAVGAVCVQWFHVGKYLFVRCIPVQEHTKVWRMSTESSSHMLSVVSVVMKAPASLFLSRCLQSGAAAPPVRKDLLHGVLMAIREHPFVLFSGACLPIAPEPDPGLGGRVANQFDNAIMLLLRPNGRQVSTSRNRVICAVFAVAAGAGFTKVFLSVEEFEAVAVDRFVSGSAPCMGVKMGCMYICGRQDDPTKNKMCFCFFLVCGVQVGVFFSRFWEQALQGRRAITSAELGFGNMSFRVE